MSRYSLGVFAEKTDARTGRSTKLQCGWRVCIVVSVALSGIAFAMAICKSYPRMDLEFDYMGIIIAIFSFLVATLIGWQIWTVIDMKGVFKKIDEQSAEFSNKISDLKDTQSLFQQSLKQYKNDNEDRNHFTQASMYKLDSKICESKKEYIDAIIQQIYSVKEYCLISDLYNKKVHIKDALIDICDNVYNISYNELKFEKLRKALSSVSLGSTDFNESWIDLKRLIEFRMETIANSMSEAERKKLREIKETIKSK